MNWRIKMLGLFIAVSFFTLLAGCKTLANRSTLTIEPTVMAKTETPSFEPGITLAPPETGSPAKPVIIDTDMAADDWMAILYLLQRTDISVKAITVSGTGEAHCQPGIKNALGLVALAGDEKIPVSCGRETPLQGDHVFPDEWRTGVDGLYGLSLPKSETAASNLPAVGLISEAIRTSPVPITFLTLGPLTNLAEVFQEDPSLADSIEMVYIMGGAVHVPGNIAVSGAGIANEVAEWNIYIDPLATRIVFESGVPITLVPLDATNDVPLSREFYVALENRHNTPEAGFVYDFYTTNDYLFDFGTMYFWDQLSAVIVSDESLSTFQNEPLCVDLSEGSSSGQTKAGEGCPIIRMAVSAKRAYFEQLFIETLNGTMK